MTVCLLTLAAWPATAEAQEVPELQVNSTNYIVVDAETGEVYAQRGAHERAALASITKVFTAIEAIERGSPDMVITTRPADLQDPQASLMGFGVGETFTLEELLYGMMLPSGNDAAHAIARSLGDRPGDTDDEAYDRFVGWMNERVENMGLSDTRFVNPHGWGVPGHYSTVSDIAAFTRYALQYPAFVDLISTSTYTTSNGYQLVNNNRMLSWYPGIIGGKTGYDWDAGWCLVEVATRGDTTMISVTFDGNAPDDWYDDNRVLLDYAFETKAARQTDGTPFRGNIVSFLDPDAAVLARTVTSAGSLPRARPIGAASVSHGDDKAAVGGGELSARTFRVDPITAPHDSMSESMRLLAALAVTVLLVGGRALMGMAEQPMPRFNGSRMRGASPEEHDPSPRSQVTS
ncbi:MAG: D-alanyl-D-alanine carboxypeptidase family protein [Thermomicrobiales bacterium]